MAEGAGNQKSYKSPNFIFIFMSVFIAFAVDDSSFWIQLSELWHTVRISSAPLKYASRLD